MNAVTVTTRGQITLRKELLDHLGVTPGDKIRFDKMPGGEIRLRAVRPAGKIANFFGSLRRERQRPISIQEMDGAIDESWAGKP